MTRHSILIVAVLLVAVIAAAQAPAPAPAPVSVQVPDAAQFVGQPKGVPLTGETLRERTDQVSALLRCPVCQGLAVADSKAEMAVNMKHQVNALLARGYTEDQILSYFEQSYGQFVLLRVVWVVADHLERDRTAAPEGGHPFEQAGVRLFIGEAGARRDDGRLLVIGDERLLQRGDHAAHKCLYSNRSDELADVIDGQKGCMH